MQLAETKEFIEIRWHGRGGQGAVTSAELLAQAAISEGKYAFVRFTLGEKDYQEAWDWVYSKWLPQSGYQPDDGSPFELMKGNDPNGEKHIVDLCIPVKPL